MKNVHILYLLIVFALSSTHKATAQLIPTPSPYEGTWHYQDGNELFIVSLWKDDEGVFRGYYKKVEYINGVIGTTIFNSRKVYNDGFIFPPVIFGHFYDQSGISGLLHDNTIENNPEDFKDGILQMQINSDTSCSSCPVTAIWKIEEESGMRVDFIPGFSIPTDVILTKVSNEIDLE